MASEKSRRYLSDKINAYDGVSIGHQWIEKDPHGINEIVISISGYRGYVEFDVTEWCPSEIGIDELAEELVMFAKLFIKSEDVEGFSIYGKIYGQVRRVK